MALFGVISAVQLVCAAVVLVLTRVASELLFSPLKAFPGPFAAKFTDFWRAFLTVRGNVDTEMRNWHKRWGRAVRVGPNAISLCDPDLIKVVYASTSKNAWRKSNMYRVNDVVVNGQKIQNIFNTQDLGFHTKYTKPIGGFWTMTKVLELEPTMDETIAMFVRKLDYKFAQASRKGSVCMMDKWLTYFAWDVAANFAFGQHYGFIEEEKDVQGMIQESTAGLHYFAPVSQIPWLDNWLDKNPVYRIGPKPLVNGFIYTVNLQVNYQKQLAEGTLKPKKVEHFIDKYNGLKAVYPDFVDDNQVINWLMLNVLAGGDSTAGSMRPVVYYLAKNPEAYQKLVDELTAAKLSLPARWRDIHNLPYLDAVIREAARICPAVGLMLEREVPLGGFQLPDGRFIPEGTKVGLNPTVVTRDIGVFGDNVDTFDPNRWLQKPGEDDETFTTRQRRMQEATDLMFGAGNRVCMGKHLAKMELYKLMATLYSEFDIKLTNRDHEWTCFNAWFMYQSDMPMVITRR